MSTKELLEELKKRGVKRVVLEFSGTDDSGGYDLYLEPSEAEGSLPEDLRRALKEWLEEELERLFDEHLLSFNDSGCEGSLVVDLENGQVEFEAWGHKQVYEEEEREFEAPFQALLRVPPPRRPGSSGRRGPPRSCGERGATPGKKAGRS